MALSPIFTKNAHFFILLTSSLLFKFVTRCPAGRNYWPYHYTTATSLNRWYKTSSAHIIVSTLNSSSTMRMSKENRDASDQAAYIIQFLRHLTNCSLSFLRLSDKCDIFCCCSLSASRLNSLFIQRCSSVYLCCVLWLFELLLPILLVWTSLIILNLTSLINKGFLTNELQLSGCFSFSFSGHLLWTIKMIGRKNPNRSVFEILKPDLIPRLKSLKTPFFLLLMHEMKFSRLPWPCLNAYMH